jgi:hypothetical protein
MCLPERTGWRWRGRQDARWEPFYSHACMRAKRGCKGCQRSAQQQRWCHGGCTRAHIAAEARCPEANGSVARMQRQWQRAHWCSRGHGSAARGGQDGPRPCAHVRQAVQQRWQAMRVTEWCGSGRKFPATGALTRAGDLREHPTIGAAQRGGGRPVSHTSTPGPLGIGVQREPEQIGSTSRIGPGGLAGPAHEVI